MQKFADRREAAIELARALEPYRRNNPIVLGIPRGGAETGYYVAKYLQAEFSLLVSRKLGYHTYPEYALGAIAEDGSIYIGEDSQNGRSEEMQEIIQEAIIEQQREIKRRVQVFRNGRPLPEIKDRVVILVDDGIATGATMLAAIKMCRNQEASRIVAAAPVASVDRKSLLEEYADEVVILQTPEDFYAVSQAYDLFTNLTDEETISFMDRQEKENKILPDVH